MTPENAMELARRASALLLDTNLAVVWVVGRFKRGEIGRYVRTEHYLPEDFDTLDNLVMSARKLTTTPHVMAETDNLLGADARNFFRACLSR